MDRRSFLRTGAGAVALGALSPSVAVAADDPWAQLGISGREPDENGIVLPEGFTSRVVATSGQVVAGSELTWHTFPDGGATFAAEDGDGFVYVSNSEIPNDAGGVGAIRFDGDGAIVDAYRILDGTNGNCAGGATPWGTWLSCEEIEGGRVWECDPQRGGNGTPLPALGSFVHEAVAVDPDGGALYLTEDRPDGRLYRFTPASYPDLASGQLEMAAVGDDGSVRWLEVPDPLARSAPTRTQVPESTEFDGGEGIVYADGSVFFTTKGDNHVWRYDVAASSMEVVYDGSGTLLGVDNITTTPRGDLLVAEDGDDLQLVLVDASGRVQPMARVTDNPASEVAGPAFDPSGTRLLFSSQRGGEDGIGRTYEIRGPFPPPRSTGAGGPSSGADGGFDAGDAVVPALAGTALLAGLAAAWRLRTRRAPEEG